MNSSGAVVSNVAYDAFGRILQQTGNQQPFLFAGEQTDPITNLTYLRARYLDRHTGQFISSDPFLGSPEQPISLHRYLYANGNPVNLTDPSGLETLTNVLTSILIFATLLALYQGLAATAAPSGLDIEWKGPTVGISVSVKNPFSLGIGFTQLESQGFEGHYTKALHLILTVGAATPNPFEKKSKVPTPTLHQKGFVQPLLTILGESLAPVDLQIGDTTLLSPSSFGGETGNDSSVLSGFYVQAGGSFNLGARSLFEKDGNPANTVGVSGTIQGFGLGYSVPDTPLTLRANAGLSISAGVSIDLTPGESKSQPDTRGPQ